jgi:hypothetical protein
MADGVDIVDGWLHRVFVVASVAPDSLLGLGQERVSNNHGGTSAMAEFAWDAGIVTLLASVIIFIGAGIVAIATSR